MRGKNNSPLSHYCLVRDDLRLREVLAYQMKKKGLDTAKIASELGLDLGNVTKFLKHGTKKLSQYNVIRICHLLGLDLKLTILPYEG